jgi:CRP-like cAMP-binding protein
LSLDPEQLHPVMARSGLWAGVSAHEAALYAEQVEAVRIDARTTIVEQGEPGDRLYVIVTGKVKITQHVAGGREAILALLGSADIVGELALIDPWPRSSTARAVTQVRAVGVDRATLRDWSSRQPGVTLELLRMLANRLRHSNDHLSGVVFSDAAARVAQQLLDLAGRFGTFHKSGVHVAHDLSQKELSQLCGASRETVNQVLATFTQRGWILVDSGSVTIRDQQALERRAR